MERRLKIEKHLILFMIGGMAYFFLEVLVRGYSHYTMFLCGGACFLCCGLLNENVKMKMSFISQMVVSAGIITALEFITGLIVNVWLKMDIWDYSNLPYNFMGQICLLYSVLWFFVSSVAIVMDDFLRYKLFHEEKPHYKIF
ncbi:putative ABC transporter permease [Anaerostipes sp. MSJ-23]|uniref:putative ABC transporter permease n=1 Tax=unclassified Anaerostipes TaxID=2635253 RepID=UPI001C101669|nr:putative ABC transporter permease [Anaerostipes sp. MSJ-23]MBU5458805.1 putative ABC transporter permease [Anaerostipes sp. MSJ-23]